MLKQLLKQQKKTQSEVAKALGISQQMVSCWCTGRFEPKISQLKSLSEILGVDVSVVVDSFCQNMEVAA